MDMSAVCRTCLSEKSLNSIFHNLKEHQRYSNAIFAATGLQVKVNDGLPQNICTHCLVSLNNYLKFRKKCIDTERRLLKIKHSEKIRNCNESELMAKSNSTETELMENISFEINNKIDINDEFTNYEQLDDDDDKPLKYLVDDREDNDNSESTEIDNSMETNIELEQQIDTGEIEQLYAPISTKTQRVTCKLCQKELSIRSIDSHMARRHPGADENKVKCELCDKYLRKANMNRHVVLMHGSGACRCGYCKLEFNTREKLLAHVATCTAKNKKRKPSESSRKLIECDVCHKSMQKASLRMHKAIKHAGLGPVCEHCGCRFSNKFRLNEHYRAKHGYEKFKCPDCDFESAAIMAMRNLTFRTLCSVRGRRKTKNHERRHRGEKPFACESCGAKFHAAYLLAQHKQSHRTEKNIKCDQCPASFKANNSLHMHKRSCHSSSLYKCCMCSRAYSCRHYAVKHLRLVHRYRGPVPRLPKDTDYVETIDLPEVNQK